MKAIQVKRSLNGGSEVHQDIAYLYNELSITYQSTGNTAKAITCIKKQIAILKELNSTSTFEFMESMSFLGEMYRDSGDVKNSIEILTSTVEL